MGILSGASDALFGSPDTGASEATYAKAQEMAEKAGILWEDLDAPTQQELLESIRYMEQVPMEEATQMGPSSMSVLSPDSELVSQQRDTLARLGQIGSEGLTPEEEYEREQLMNSIAGSEQARQKSILQNMQERGAGGSGVEAAAMLQSSQSAANRASQEAKALEVEKYRRALQGMTAAGQMAGQMRGQDFSEGAQKASAADRIAQFNALQRAGVGSRNTAYARNIGEAKANTVQQAYNNQLQKIAGQSNAYSGQASQLGQQAGGQSQAALQEWSAGPELFGSLVGAGATYAAAAKGGIVKEGGKGYGDDVQLNVNEDEMVLNKRQQANILNILGVSAGEGLTPEQQEVLFKLADSGNLGNVNDIGEQMAPDVTGMGEAGNVSTSPSSPDIQGNIYRPGEEAAELYLGNPYKGTDGVELPPNEMLKTREDGRADDPREIAMDQELAAEKMKKKELSVMDAKLSNKEKTQKLHEKFNKYKELMKISRKDNNRG